MKRTGTTILLVLVMSFSIPIGCTPPEDNLTVGTREVDEIIRENEVIDGTYSSILRVSNSPVSWNDAKIPLEDRKGYFSRVTTINQEIYVGILIEKIAVTEGGLSEKRISLRRVKSWEFTEAFQIIGEFTQFHVWGWLSETSFIADSMGKIFLFTGIDRERIVVKEISEDEAKMLDLKDEPELLSLKGPDVKVIKQDDSRSRVKKGIAEIPK